MGLSGWSPEAVEFFEGLRAGHTRTYWNAHQEFYQASVRGPMAESPGDLSGESGPGRIARPCRDIRFRAGKSPYKTEIYATLDRGGYVRFGADGLTAALGYYMMTTAQLHRYRQAVNDETDGAALAGAMARLRAAGLRAGGGQMLKTAPRGYPSDHPRIGAAPRQGPDLLAAMAARAVAGHGESQGPRGGLLAHRRPAAQLAGPARRTGPHLTSRPRPGPSRPARTMRDVFRAGAPQRRCAYPSKQGRSRSVRRSNSPAAP